MIGSFKLFLSALLVSVPLCNSLAQTTYEEEYNLGFSLSGTGGFYGWGGSGGNSPMVLRVDSTRSGLPLRFLQRETWGHRERLRLDISSKPILLPARHGDMVRVKISCRCRNVGSGSLLVHSLDGGMGLLRTDSVRLRESEGFHEDAVAFDAPGARFLSLRVIAAGSDSTYSGGVAGVGESLPQEIALDRIEIMTGGVFLNSRAFEDVPAPSVAPDACLALSPDGVLTADQLGTMGSRITALGESVHGSRKLGRAAFDFMKSGILNGGVSMLLFEQSIHKMLFFNRYVLGAGSITPDRLRKLLDGSLIDVDALLELTEWIREYNEHAPVKVQMRGLDEDSGVGGESFWLYNYLLDMRKEVQSSALDSVSSYITNTKDRVPLDYNMGALMLLEKHQEALKGVLGSDVEIMTKYLRYVVEENPEQIPDYLQRDRRMFGRAAALIENFLPPESNAVIYSHLDHARYGASNFSELKPFGAHMRERYGDSYSCIGMTVQDDSVKVYSHGKLKRVELPPPPPNGIERSLSRTGLERLYVPASKIGELVTLREQGSSSVSASSQKSYLCPERQLKGLLFVK